ncbi:MAG: hypothetical protein AAF610_03930 [Pseudomonadota bacterium]
MLKGTIALGALLSGAFAAASDSMTDQAVGVRIDDHTLLAIAEHSPPAASLLWSFRPGIWSPPSNLLEGQGVGARIPTIESLKAHMTGASAEAAFDAMALPERGEASFMRWQGTIIDEHTIAVTVEALRGPSGAIQDPSLLTRAFPDIRVLVRRSDPEVLTFTVGDDDPLATPVPPLDAMGTLKDYLTQMLLRNYDRAAALVHPEMARRMAPDGDLEAQLAVFEHTLPMWFELGEARTYRGDTHQLVLVPAHRVLQGFPADIRSPMTYAVASHDAGATWRVVDNACLNIEWAQRLFPGFDQTEFDQLRNRRFDVSTVISIDPYASGHKTASR